MNGGYCPGAANMLAGCGGLAEGDRVLIVHEPPGLGYYDDALPGTVAATARALGLHAETREVPFSDAVSEPGSNLAAAMQAADLTVFLARMGDQIRFRAEMRGKPVIVCYALDCEMLGSRFGRMDHRALLDLRHLLDHALATARTIRVTCPEGTDFAGRVAAPPARARRTTITRFPLSVFTPIPAAGFSGRIAQRGFLVGTGSHYYAPYACGLEDTLAIAFDGHRITGFSGTPRDVATAEAHYQSVADRYGLDATYLHSWHAGIHPGLSFPTPAAASFERWSGGAFGNPRLMHFHSCGAYAPGEISLNLRDPTIRLDGVALWEEGRLHPERVPGGAALLAAQPELAAAFADPAPDCGLGPDGRLAFA